MLLSPWDPLEIPLQVSTSLSNPLCLIHGVTGKSKDTPKVMNLAAVTLKSSLGKKSEHRALKNTISTLDLTGKEGPWAEGDKHPLNSVAGEVWVDVGSFPSLNAHLSVIWPSLGNLYCPGAHFLSYSIFILRVREGRLAEGCRRPFPFLTPTGPRLDVKDAKGPCGPHLLLLHSFIT